MRRDSWRSVPMTCKPPRSGTPEPSLMSVPRPAMLVEMVTVPGWPARETISASCRWNLALSTLCGIFSRLSMRLKSSEDSTLAVPTRTGCWSAWRFLICSMTALYFSRRVL